MTERFQIDLAGLFVADRPSSAAGESTAGPPWAQLADDVFAHSRARARRPPTSNARSTKREGSPRRPPTSRQDAPRATGLLRPGTIVDKYRIEELLGIGGFAAVYRATHLLLRMPVAIKLLRPDVIARAPHVANELFEEARYAARVNHPNVVRVFDVTHTKEITYIVMDFIEGKSLARTLERDGALSGERIVDIGLDVAAGLAAALKEGLIHRDIKPANILVASSGEARIVDLGLARGVIETEPEARQRRTRVVGTRGYMAPEQAKDPDNVDFRADVYALGVTLYEAATDRPPLAWRDSSSARLPTAPAHLPERLARLLSWMTSPEVEARPASYEQLVRALKDARSGSSGAT